MTRTRSILFLLAAVVLAGAYSAPVQACAACFGQSDSKMAQGMNMGIFALLMVITTVLCGVAGFFVYVARRTAAIDETSAGNFGNNLPQHQTNG